MISFEKYKRAEKKDCCFTIIIPTWNNLKYLELCVNSIRKNSAYQHQIVIAINEGVDGTLQWVENQGLDYIYAKENIGICYALNACRSLIDTKFVLYANDDMYFLPNWDVPILERINQLTDNQRDIHKYYMISSTLIEPSGNNPCVVVRDFGTDIETFREAELLKEQPNLIRSDWRGSTWPPNDALRLLGFNRRHEHRVPSRNVFRPRYLNEDVERRSARFYWRRQQPRISFRMQVNR